MEFRVLGPLSVTTDTGETLEIGRPKLRLLLTVLLANANSVVSVESLVDSLWEVRPVRSARANLKTYIWALRRVLAPADPASATISTDPHGYSIKVPPDRLDMLVFERLAGAGRAAREQGDDQLAGVHFEESLALWRGSAFADVPSPTQAIAATVTHLEEQRLTVVEELFDVRVRSGRHAEVVGELQTWVLRYPLREHLWEQLMLALYRDGRQAEALAAYQRLRRRLIDDIGVEPSPSVQALHRRILATDPALSQTAEPVVVTAAKAAPTPPRQLPLDVATFVGRDEELDRVERHFAEAHANGPSLLVIHGSPGVGKSALAIRSTRLAAHRFPDGQLYLNLHGATPGATPMSPTDALGRFLRSLGVPASDVPYDLDEAATLFRTLTADRRILVVLDNAASTTQVRPLLPAGPDAAVLVTSRASLAALDGATHLHLSPLHPDAAYAMLDRLIHTSDRARDPAATRRLARLCDHLPLGLQLAGSRLKTRPTWTVAHMVERLTDERHRLAELAVGDLAVRTSLSVSYTALQRSDDPGDRAAARALCLLGPLRVNSIDLSLAAALFDTSVVEAGQVVEHLVDAHLVEAAEPGRYYLHDLVRLFAAEVAAERSGRDEVDAALTRGFRHLLSAARQCATLAYPRRTHYPVEVETAVPPPSGPDQAREWLERERNNLVSAARQALPGPVEHARLGVGIALSLHWFFLHARYPQNAIGLLEETIQATRRLGDRRSEANAHDSLGCALLSTGKLAEGMRRHEAGLAICREIGDSFGEQRALGNLGNAHLIRSQPEEAIPFLERQLALARAIDAEIGEAYALLCLGVAYNRLGRSDEAAGLLNRALAWSEQARDDYVASAVLVESGSTYIRQGRLPEAIVALERSIERARRAGYQDGEARALTALVQAWRLLGCTDTALRYAQEASSLAEASSNVRVKAALRTECAELVTASQ
ncbi:tetratricopeptide repeat protein [Plantactinospora sp. S1510]|uniref:Tetratricopeptide repeat protein n=1 Tax=Plantactinospora alkalitolerans TaxID=2789879 RepID=A0ABS0GXC1_9ACTN|nr:BTAD domain-containing putative transcriptional regulator [Plantactinospora alkalitolerans]MBF9130847.1 tetratricopeptide repeat protein [Plantactinospora alkalitolerans]